jgi:hypothetical protein
VQRLNGSYSNESIFTLRATRLLESCKEEENSRKLLLLKTKKNDENKERVHPIDSTLKTFIVLIESVQEGKFTM